jgi:hypothetical protein
MDAQTYILPCDCEPMETVGAAIRLSEEASFDEITKATALSEGLLMLAKHLQYKDINLVLMIANFFSYYRACKKVKAEFEGETVLSFLLEIIDGHLVELPEEGPSEPESET